MNDTSALFEFIEPDGTARWIATPGKQTTFPLSIRNETSEGHEIAVLVEDPTSWAWAVPQRVSFNPGESRTVSIVFAPNRDTHVAAGEHKAAIRLRDLEGVIFAECMRSFEVEERQELSMTVTLRGPLMSFGQAEGFVLHCTLANRGNVDVVARPVGDAHPALTFSERAVSVPFRGEVAFDIEVRWNAARRNNHPNVVTLRAAYTGGEAQASIEWRYIAEALEPFMPIYSTVEEEDEFLSLSWLPQPGEDVLDHRLPDIPKEEPQAAPSDQHRGDEGGSAAVPTDSAEAHRGQPAELAEQSHPPSPALTPAILAAQHHARMARRISPWWPVVQIIGGKWRVKPLPILMAIIAVEGFTIGMTQAQRDYYASPELLQPIPHVSRAFLIGSHAAQAIEAGAKNALSATLRAGKRLSGGLHFGRARTPATATPSLWGLQAAFINPHTLAVTYHESGVSSLRLLVASGNTVIYDKPVSATSIIIRVPQQFDEPLRVTVSGSAPGGIDLRQHVFLQQP